MDRSHLGLFSVLFLIPSLASCQKHNPLIITLGQNQGHAAQPGTANIPIIIVAGQSNALGLGQLSPSPVGQEIIWAGLDHPRGIGVSFAESYLRQTGRSQVIVIQCAVGSTSIAQWAPGGSLNTQCLGYYDQVKQTYPTAQLAAILFWQGEADTTTPGIPWASEFTSLVSYWRTTFGQTLPIIFCQLDGFVAPQAPVNWPYWSQIQAEQASVNLKFVSMVKTNDLNAYAPDGLHVAAPSLDIIGQRMGLAYFALINE